MTKQFLIDIENKYEDYINLYSTIYIVGKSGLKKTTYILDFLKNRKYDYTYTSLQQIKTNDDFLNSLKNRNICSMFSGNNMYKKKVLVIDNIDYLQNTEKKILGNILKILKNKKFNENFKNYSIIFIGNNLYDKKQIELSLCVEHYIFLNDLYSSELETSYNIQAMKKNVLDLIKDNYNKGINLNNEKTIISLCYHENVIKIMKDKKIYELFLKNICNGDFYDRISFQKQLWQFNEMTFYLKVLYNYQIVHEYYIKNNISPMNILKNKKLEDICFTKVLTKYSTEYNNTLFILYNYIYKYRKYIYIYLYSIYNTL